MEKVTLKNPIPYGKETLSEITLREPMSGDMRGIGLRPLVVDMDADALITLLPRIASPAVTKEQAAHLSLHDMAIIFGVVSGFLGDMTDSPTTSKPPLP